METTRAHKYTGGKKNGSEFVQYYVYLSSDDSYLKLPKQPVVALFSLL
jgi:hypothetical protein